MPTVHSCQGDKFACETAQLIRSKFPDSDRIVHVRSNTQFPQSEDALNFRSSQFMISPTHFTILQVYTWMDAPLRELSDMIKEVRQLSPSIVCFMSRGHGFLLFVLAT